MNQADKRRLQAELDALTARVQQHRARVQPIDDASGFSAALATSDEVGKAWLYDRALQGFLAVCAIADSNACAWQTFLSEAWIKLGVLSESDRSAAATMLRCLLVLFIRRIQQSDVDSALAAAPCDDSEWLIVEAPTEHAVADAWADDEAERKRMATEKAAADQRRKELGPPQGQLPIRPKPKLPW